MPTLNDLIRAFSLPFTQDTPRCRMSAKSLAQSLGAAALVAAAAITCTSDKTIVTPRPNARDGASRSLATDPGSITVCKKGGPAGTYNYHVAISGGGDW